MANDYKCGLNAGDRLMLIKDLDIHENGTNRYVTTYPAGGIWEVLPPCRTDPVLWLRQPDGERHTWDDTADVFNYFRRLDEHSASPDTTAGSGR